MQVLIADDEEDARELMKVHLARHPDLMLVGEAKDGLEAVKLIKEKKPNLVFLDIQMPELSGLEAVEKLDFSPHIIFITAYDEYAVRAFELNALDYLLKPFSEQRFDDAIHRFLERAKAPTELISTYLSLQADLDPSKHRDQFLKRISYREGPKTHFIDVSDIQVIEAADQYVEIYTPTGKHLVRQSMDYLEHRLDPELFFRTHRSAIVRLAAVAAMEQYEPKNALVHLKSGRSVRLSQSRKALFQTKLGL